MTGFRVPATPRNPSEKQAAVLTVHIATAAFAACVRRRMRAPVTTIRYFDTSPVLTHAGTERDLRPGDLVTSSWASVDETTYCNSGELHVNDFALDRTTRVRAASPARLLPSEGTHKDQRGRVRRLKTVC